MKLSAKGVSGAKSSKAEADLSGLVTGKQGVKYAGFAILLLDAYYFAGTMDALSNPLVHMGPMALAALFLIGISWGQCPVNPRNFRHGIPGW